MKFLTTSSLIKETVPTYGKWLVWLESEIEQIVVGIFEGYIDHIAFKLGSCIDSYENLHFKLIDEVKSWEMVTEDIRRIRSLNIFIEEDILETEEGVNRFISNFYPRTCFGSISHEGSNKFKLSKLLI